MADRSPQLLHEKPLFDKYYEDEHEDRSLPGSTALGASKSDRSELASPSNDTSTLDYELSRARELDNNVHTDLDLDAVEADAAARYTVSTIVKHNAARYSQPEAKKKVEKTADPVRKAIPKLDSHRLLGDDGFPALLKVYKDFKPKGKGHESEDLTRLLQMYQFWTHKMFPKMQFDDAVNRIEKLCHEKRMLSALSVWKDGPTLVGDDDNVDESAEEQDGAQPPISQGHSTPASSIHEDPEDWHELLLHSDAATSRSSSIEPPPTSEDDIDYDEIQYDAVDQRAPNNSGSRTAVTHRDLDLDDDDEMDDEMDEMDEMDLAMEWADGAPIVFGQAGPITVPTSRDTNASSDHVPINNEFTDDELAAMEIGM